MSSNWKGSFPLPAAVEQFYQEVGPTNITIEAHSDLYFLPSLSGLWKFQAGYRWNGMTRKPIEDWNEDWLVIADAGGDPFIFDRSSAAILYAQHGEGEWSAVPLFPDLNTMAACLAELGAIVSNADGADSFLGPALHKRTLARLQDLIGAEAQAERILNVLGWD